ncbi:hypothetical protein BY458DRAFT_432540 [Sporodiniella umbellata]|nr:hypothetical protein BY458DRAFT_432540 [Sporodiniella umbellata]
MLEISLLPEFGWSIMNKPVYGPGSVFQGFVKIQANVDKIETAQQLRLIFHASESIQNSFLPKPLIRQQLFGTQSILWRKADKEIDGEAAFPFIVQIPMVQFPPSANVSSQGNMVAYQTRFTLSAFLDTESSPILEAHKTILYRPFLETHRLKVPQSVSNAKIHSLLKATDYLPGDTIHLTLSTPAQTTLLIQLIQTQIWKKTPDFVHPGNTERTYESVLSQQSVMMTPGHEETRSIAIPIDAIPSFDYSALFSVRYHLKVSTGHKSLWASHTSLPPIPVHLGTLTYGIRSPKDIQLYTNYKPAFASQPDPRPSLPTPRFLDVIDYEESLPMYERSRLPAYEQVQINP